MKQAHMTRVHFQTIASMIGAWARFEDMDDATFERLVTHTHRFLAPTNPAYSRDKVREWAQDVRTGVRDINGDKR